MLDNRHILLADSVHNYHTLDTGLEACGMSCNTDIENWEPCSFHSTGSFLLWNCRYGNTCRLLPFLCRVRKAFLDTGSSWDCGGRLGKVAVWLISLKIYLRVS